MVSKLHSAQVVGLSANHIIVEVDIAKGLHSFAIVGLPDKAIEESKDRISAAIKNSGFKSPQKSNKKVIVSLAPADLKKEGPVFDLAVAMAYLLAGKEINFNAEQRLIVGELALDGSVREIKGALMIARLAKRAGFRELYLPRANAAEAALIADLTVYPVDTLRQLADHLSPPNPTDELEPPVRQEITPAPATEIVYTEAHYPSDMSEIRGQETAKRGLEIAAAGGHNVAMSGPPGTGKTMLAKAFTSILPPLSFNDILEVTGIHSAAGLLEETLITAAPFRSPHHTSSYVSLVGGGAWPKPGEITLAHRGVLFLDEFPEFEKRVIEALRQPLEDRVINVARARGSLSFPADFILIAAMNPCPCGHRGSRGRECVCSPMALARYGRKISGPIIDRIDLWLEVGPIDHEKLAGPTLGESSASLRARVEGARARQAARLRAAGREARTNSQLNTKDLRLLAPLSESSTKLLNEAAKKLDLSARAYHRIIKLARTIADLAGDEGIKDEHLIEALQYRPRAIAV